MSLLNRLSRQRREEFKSQALVHVGPLTRTAHRLCGSWESAEDAVQETYLQAWKYWTGDGRHVSLFIGRDVTGVPSGELTEKLNGPDLQLAHLSGLAVFGAGDGGRLLFAAAPDDNVARAALLGILEN